MMLKSPIPQIYRLQFKLGAGSLKTGFPNAQLQLYVPGSDREFQVERVSLPPAPELAEHWQCWRDGYPTLARQKQTQSTEHQTRLELNIDAQRSASQNFSEVQWHESHEKIVPLLKSWLNLDKLDQVERQLIKTCSNADEIHIEVELENLNLCQFPWHLWRFLSEFPGKAEVSYTLSERRNPSVKQPPRDQVRVLVIIGYSQGVDVQGDLEALKTLRLDLSIHNEPSRKEFQALLRDPQGWDILFYGGHSESQGERGRLFINKTESISLEELSDSLSVAIKRGLKLAFFNSCDGMGLAKTTSELGLPATLMMLQPVPNGIAVNFAQYFLQSFSQGNSCYIALAQARSQLQELEKKFLCASWMPALFRNGSVEPPTWKDIRYGDRWQRRIRQLKAGVAIAVGVSAAIVGMSYQGWLEPVELKAYDWMLRHRPNEGPDPRILLVKVTTEDLNDLRDTYENWSRDNFIPDEVLEQLLNKLRDRYQAVTIGIDFQQYDSPFLTQWMQKDKATYAIYGDQKIEEDKKPLKWKPPKGVPADQLGFAHFLLDQDDRTRRFLFSQCGDDGENCQLEEYAFAFKLAFHYLEFAEPESRLERDAEDNLVFNGLTFTPISSDFGGYVLPAHDMVGSQLMLNYRASQSVARSVTLDQVLNDELSEQEIQSLQHRLVIVGGVIEDLHLTPYGVDTRGIEIQAHIVSQIIAAVKDQRPFMTGLPAFAKVIFIFGSALLVIPVFWFSSGTGLKLLLFLTAAGFIGLISYVALCNGLWIPVAAPSLSLIFAVMLGWGYQLKVKTL